MASHKIASHTLVQWEINLLSRGCYARRKQLVEGRPLLVDKTVQTKLSLGRVLQEKNWLHWKIVGKKTILWDWSVPHFRINWKKNRVVMSLTALPTLNRFQLGLHATFEWLDTRGVVTLDENSLGKAILGWQSFQRKLSLCRFLQKKTGCIRKIVGENRSAGLVGAPFLY
jgi:hypothetical protein